MKTEKDYEEFLGLLNKNKVKYTIEISILINQLTESWVLSQCWDLGFSKNNKEIRVYLCSSVADYLVVCDGALCSLGQYLGTRYQVSDTS